MGSEHLDAHPLFRHATAEEIASDPTVNSFYVCGFFFFFCVCAFMRVCVFVFACVCVFACVSF